MSIKRGNLFFLLITFRQLSSVKDHSFIVQSADVVKSTWSIGENRTHHTPLRWP